MSQRDTIRTATRLTGKEDLSEKASPKRSPTLAVLDSVAAAGALLGVQRDKSLQEAHVSGVGRGQVIALVADQLHRRCHAAHSNSADPCVSG